MNYIEYSTVSTKTYIDYCNYLLEKYGAVNGDYFSANFIPNMDIKRRDENLFIHHMREDRVANLSNIDIARANDFEYQKAHNLVYANLLEHILLHIMIGEQNYTLGFGGAELMIGQANDYISDAEDYDIVLEALKERLRNDLASCETLLQHNATVFYELDDTLSKYDRALVVIGTGLGKTTTALAYIRKYGMRGLVLGPNRVITEAWDKNEDVDTYTYQWFMNNYKSIDYSKYGVMICDEAHHCAAARWGEGIRYALDNGLIKVMGLTATPKESKDKKNLETSRQFFQNHICQGFTVLDGIEREIIHDFSYVGAIYDTTDIKEICGKCSDTALLGELDLAINNTPTVKEILTRHMPNNKRKGIIFVSNIEAINEAIDIMRDIYPNIEYRAMHSLMPANEIEENREWFQNTDEGYLLAVNMISEGAHYKDVNTIIMFRRTQSSLVFYQQLGRIITLVRYEDPHAIVFDLVNNATNLDAEKGFSASLREAYRQRKARGGKQKSEQIIVEDYSEKISEILKQIAINDTIWSEGDIKILMQFYPIEGGDILTRFNYRYSLNAIHHKASRLGLKSPNHIKKILCLETETVYESISEAVKILGLKSNHIAEAASGKIKTAHGYHWIYADLKANNKTCADIIQEIENERKKGGKDEVAVVCLETGQIYISCTEAAKIYGVDESNIRAAVTGKTKTSCNLHWRYQKDLTEHANYNEIIQQIELGRKRPGSKRVRCIETNKTFDSAGQASQVLGLSRGRVSDAISKGRMAGGYHWEYLD